MPTSALWCMLPAAITDASSQIPVLEFYTNFVFHAEYSFMFLILHTRLTDRSFAIRSLHHCRKGRYAGIIICYSNASPASVRRAPAATL